jgi:hypothetical protein
MTRFPAMALRPTNQPTGPSSSSGPYLRRLHARSRHPPGASSVASLASETIRVLVLVRVTSAGSPRHERPNAGDGSRASPSPTTRGRWSRSTGVFHVPLGADGTRGLARSRDRRAPLSPGRSVWHSRTALSWSSRALSGSGCRSQIVDESAAEVRLEAVPRRCPPIAMSAWNADAYPQPAAMKRPVHWFERRRDMPGSCGSAHGVS